MKPHPRSGGILARALVCLLALGAAAVLAWMLLLPAAVQSRFAAAVGAELRLHGLAADPFSGRATVTGWTLHANESPEAPVLARGGASRVVTSDWHAALADPAPATMIFDQLQLHVTEALLAPDPEGRWPLLGLAAAAGLPYEKGGPVGEGPRLLIRRLSLKIDTVIVKNAHDGSTVPVPIGWRGNFDDLDHTRPVLESILTAVRQSTTTPPPAARP